MLRSGIIDPREVVERELWQKSWPYWSYTRRIAENLYGSDAFSSIALTNFIKCTNVDGGSGQFKSLDKTTFRMADCCVLKLGVIWREVELLQAKTAVFYTYGLFRETLKVVPVALSGTLKERTPQDHSVLCRNKRLGWWERTFRTSWTDNFRLLVVGHPERMGREEYVELISNWIRPA